ncbi:glycosyltransferase family 2 protein [Paracoccus sp. Z330]|uniref:Glycosyltransferase family 2 protein n=1 Tax=Paracoccus onchidii TaxID=3017813 RepID=A0ABT4ZBC2_9RHOB|nr:glycosyltransferase family 2 protein [Paracoccus onchidii]MDB6176658.1 glycosyltransferase family 2 protein [Paracoccus onchidii]
MTQTPPSASNPDVRTDDRREVQILMASYQGARYIQEQLNSIATQAYPHWRLFVSDDGSQDDTRRLIANFADTHGHRRIHLIDGPRQGATQNFLHLIRMAPRDRMLAFCDQDDVWHPEKIERAVSKLARISGPAHYAARTTITDENLEPVAQSRHFSRPLTFRNALVQACMAGNTSVFNPAAAALLKAGVEAASSADIQSHDWWAYQLTSGAGAKIIHDHHPVLLYRQHGMAEMGRNDTTSAMAKRLGQLFAGDFGKWVAANHTALNASRTLLTEDNRRILDLTIAALRCKGPVAAQRLYHLGLYRQTRAGTAALMAATATGRLRQPFSASRRSR